MNVQKFTNKTFFKKLKSFLRFRLGFVTNMFTVYPQKYLLFLTIKNNTYKRFVNKI